MKKIGKKELEYISLQEATEYCDYSQEYLSLRVRQGKLKAVKFGRNWVTKKEWLNEYLQKIEEYNNNFKIKKVAFPKNLPIEKIPVRQSFLEKNLGPVLRFGFLAALVFVFLGTGVVFGNTLNSYVIEFNEKVGDFNTRSYKGMTKLAENLCLLTSDVNKHVNNTFSATAEKMATISLPEISAPEISDSAILATISDTFKEIPQIIIRGYTVVDNFIEQKISLFKRQIAEGGQEIAEMVSTGFKKKISPPSLLVKSDEGEEIETLKSQNQELKEKIAKLEKEGMPAKEIIREIEVSKITKIEPIKEITKEKIITKIDDEELKKLKTQIAEFSLWGTDIEELRNITKKLQSRPTATMAASAPIYIASQGLQVGGAGIFASLGVSGSAGIGNLGVGGSTSLGSTSSDSLTVNATSSFKSPVTAEAGLTVGTSTLVIDSSGNITTTGSITATGDIIVTGAITSGQEFSITPLAAAPTSPTEGTLYYDSTTDKMYVWANDSWVDLTSQGTTQLAGLTGDVSITTPSDNQLLKYNSTSAVWENWSPDYITGIAWGDITGTLADQTDLQTILDGKESTISSGTATQYWKGDKTWQELTTAAVSESGNIYFTQTRARESISETAVGLDYSNTTGVLSLTANYEIPTTTKTGQWNTAYGWGQWDDIPEAADYSALTGGTGIGHAVTGTLTFDAAELTNLIWSAGGSSTFTHTYNVQTGTDPVFTFGDGIINVTTGALQVSGATVQTGTDLTDDTVSGTELDALLFSSNGLLRRTAENTFDTITDSSTNWNTAYTYSAVGHLPLAGGIMTGNIIFEGASVDEFETILTVEDPTTPDKTLTLPNFTGYLVADATKVTDIEGTGLSITDGTLNFASAGLTWAGNVIGLSAGGTGKNLTAANGGIVWSDTDSLEILGAGSAGQMLISGGAGTPVWTTTTMPGTAALGSILAANTDNTLSAVTSTSGTKVLTNTGGTITWETLTASSVTETWAGTVQQAIDNLKQMTGQIRPISQVLEIIASHSGSIVKSVDDYVLDTGQTSGDVLTDVISSDSKLLLYFKSLKLAVDNGDGTVQVEIYGNADSFALPLNGTTRFAIVDPTNLTIDLKRKDETEVATGAAQTTWTMNAAGCFPAVAVDEHKTILAQEIGVAAVLVVEKSVLGTFADSKVLEGGTDYTVDYSTRTETKITLSISAASDITTSSKLRITWVADVMDIDNSNINTSLKLKIYLNRTDAGDATPKIQPVSTGKYVEMLYEYTSKPMLTEKDILQHDIETLTMANVINDAMGAGVSADDIATQINTAIDEGTKTASQIGGIFNTTNLTAANLNLICDSSNITSANIKAVLDSGNVTVASQLGAVLEGTSLTAAHAANVCENKYTDAQKAAAFDNAIMSPARSADIFNEAGFSAANKALVFNEAGFSAANKALVFNEAGFSAANKAAVCNHTNLAAAVLNSICDNTNISSATIKAILDIGSVTVASQLGAMLEGTQLTAANAATFCEAGTVSDDQLNAACDNAIMSSARIKAILDTGTVTSAGPLGAILEGAQLTAANAAAVVEAHYTPTQIGNAYNNAIMSDARVNTICDDGLSTSARIKAILDTAAVTVAGKLGACLEGAQLTAANAAAVVEAHYTPTQIGNAYNNAIMSDARVNTICDDGLSTSARIKAILDTAAVTVAGKLGACLEGAQLTAANAATFCEAGTVSDVQLNAACDDAIMSSARIKAVLDTGTVTTAGHLGAMLEGTQLTAANAATFCEAGTVSDNQLNSACDNAIMSSARIKAILDIGTVTTAGHLGAMLEGAQLTAANAATFCNAGTLTDAQLAGAFEDTIMSIARINSIIIDANITDSKAQEILNATAYATRDLTSASAILYAIHDDWTDNKYSSRDNRATTPASVLGANEFAQKFRPEWTVTSGTSWGVTSGYLHVNTHTDTIQIDSIFTTGTWEIGRQYAALDNAGNAIIGKFYPMWIDSSNYFDYALGDTSGSGSNYNLSKNVSGTPTTLISNSWNYNTNFTTYKFTKNSSSNLEIFEGGVSKGTDTDSDISTSNKIQLWYMRWGGGSGSQCRWDNLKVY